jgi:GNAT superfamily N-acetyltransferase
MAAMMMTAASQAVVSRKTPRTPHAWEAVRTIYESSFPAAERLAFDCVFQQDRGQLVWLAQAVAHHTVAFAVVLPLPGTRAALLEYIAVDAAWRSRGIGRHLLDVIVADVGG